MKLLFIVNPISGGVNKEPFLTEAKALCEKYGINYKIFKTTGENDLENATKVLHEFQPDKVVSVGGDGTTLFTSLLLMDTDYPFGIIPLGSANGMATELYVNPTPVEALKDIIMSETIAGLDLIKINDKYFTLHLGDVGVNAQLVQAYEKDSQRGMSTYAKYFIDQLTHLDPFTVSITLNGQKIEEKAHMVAICNARKYGTGVALNTTGNPMDGLFEIVVIKDINVISLINAGLSTIDENYINNNTSLVYSTKKASISFQQPRLLQLDGEVIGEFEEIHVELLEGAVNYITTKENLYLK